MVVWCVHRAAQRPTRGSAGAFFPIVRGGGVLLDKGVFETAVFRFVEIETIGDGAETILEINMNSSSSECDRRDAFLRSFQS